MQDEEAKLAKANKLDLIFNVLHPIADFQGLQSEYYEFGNVYLGMKQAVSEQYVYEKCIGAIVTVMDKKSYEKEKIRERITALGLESRHLFIDAKDSKDVKIIPYFSEIYEFIEAAIENKENILVHCKGGMSRSPSMLCSYIIKKFNLTFDEAYKILKERRNVIEINEGFQKELKDYQKQLNKK